MWHQQGRWTDSTTSNTKSKAKDSIWGGYLEFVSLSLSLYIYMYIHIMYKLPVIKVTFFTPHITSLTIFSGLNNDLVRNKTDQTTSLTEENQTAGIFWAAFAPSVCWFQSTPIFSI